MTLWKVLQETFWILVYSPAAIPLLEKDGIPLKAATCVATVGGNIAATLGWTIFFVLADHLSWIRKILRRMEGWGTTWIPRNGIFRKLPYLLILLISVLDIWVGFAIARCFGLNRWAVLVMTLFASTVKNCASGGFLLFAAHVIPNINTHILLITICLPWIVWKVWKFIREKRTELPSAAFSEESE